MSKQSGKSDKKRPNKKNGLAKHNRKDCSVEGGVCIRHGARKKVRKLCSVKNGLSKQKQEENDRNLLQQLELLKEKPPSQSSTQQKVRKLCPLSKQKQEENDRNLLQQLELLKEKPPSQSSTQQKVGKSDKKRPNKKNGLAKHNRKDCSVEGGVCIRHGARKKVRKFLKEKPPSQSSTQQNISDIVVCEDDIFCGQVFDNIINDFLRRRSVKSGGGGVVRRYKVSKQKDGSMRKRLLCMGDNNTCPNIDIQGGVCTKHGATRKTCNHEGCTSNTRGKEGVCAKHGAKKLICKYEGCTNNVQNGGVCRRHGAKKYIYPNKKKSAIKRVGSPPKFKSPLSKRRLVNQFTAGGGGATTPGRSNVLTPGSTRRTPASAIAVRDTSADNDGMPVDDNLSQIDEPAFDTYSEYHWETLNQVTTVAEGYHHITINLNGAITQTGLRFAYSSKLLRAVVTEILNGCPFADQIKVGKECVLKN